MFGKSPKGASSAKIDSLIAVGTRVEGNIQFSGGLRIDGEVKGGVSALDGSATSVLILSERAIVEGPVEVAHLLSNGTIIGSVSVDVLEMQPKSKVVGDVQYRSMEMRQGAVIEGRLLHRDAQELEPTFENEIKSN